MTRYSIILCAILFLLTGCVGVPSSQTKSTVVNNVAMSLWVSHQSLTVGQPLQIRFTVHNFGSQTAIFQTQIKPIFQLSIAGTILRTNEVVLGPLWPGDGELTPQLTRLEIKSGETKTIVEMTWTPDERFDRALVGVSVIFWSGINDSNPNVLELPVTIGFT